MRMGINISFTKNDLGTLFVVAAGSYMAGFASGRSFERARLLERGKLPKGSLSLKKPASKLLPAAAKAMLGKKKKKGLNVRLRLLEV